MACQSPEYFDGRAAVNFKKSLVARFNVPVKRPKVIWSENESSFFAWIKEHSAWFNDRCRLAS